MPLSLYARVGQFLEGWSDSLRFVGSFGWKSEETQARYRHVVVIFETTAARQLQHIVCNDFLVSSSLVSPLGSFMSESLFWPSQWDRKTGKRNDSDQPSRMKTRAYERNWDHDVRWLQLPECLSSKRYMTGLVAQEFILHDVIKKLSLIKIHMQNSG